MKNVLPSHIDTLKCSISIVYSIFILFLLNSCHKPEDLIVEGLVPIVIGFDDVSKVKSTVPRPFFDTGKIVSVGNYLFINEEGKGIHVIDNTIPSSPVNLYFWEIPGNFEFTIDGNFLFADNSRHIFVIDITNFTMLVVVDIIKDVYNPTFLAQTAPPNYKGWFECFTVKQGILIGWEKKVLTNPLCHTR